jgi:hypothetical protein
VEVEAQPLPRFAGALERILENGDEPAQRHAGGAAERIEFDHIDAAFPTFAFADERLRRTDAPSEFLLRQAGLCAHRSIYFEKNRIAARMNGFLHCVRARNGIRYSLIWDSPK